MRKKNDTSRTKVENLIYFTDRIIKSAHVINIDNHHSKHANSTITIFPKFINSGNDISYINKPLEEFANFYA